VTCGSSELEKDVSCRGSDHGWRTKLDFCSGKSFDDLHRPTTLGAAIEIGRVSGGGSACLGWRFLYGTEQSPVKSASWYSRPKAQ
jgi:hypothetical protein